MRNPHFFQNCGTFQYNNNKYHNFERNDYCATVFLKWMDFSSIFCIHFRLNIKCLELKWDLKVGICLYGKQLSMCFSFSQSDSKLKKANSVILLRLSSDWVVVMPNKRGNYTQMPRIMEVDPVPKRNSSYSLSLASSYWWQLQHTGRFSKKNSAYELNRCLRQPILSHL